MSGKLSAASALRAENAFRESIVCFGDSITQHGYCAHGWVAQLAEAYRRRADVFNRGFSGYNTRYASEMARIVLAPPPRAHLLTTVFFGANDAADASMKREQHVPVAEYKQHVTNLARAAAGISRAVVVISPPPVDSLRWPDRTLARTREYRDAAREAVASLAHAGGDAPLEAAPCVLFLDAFALFEAEGEAAAADLGRYGAAPCGPRAPGEPGWFLLLSDGLHLSPAGNTALARALLALVAQSAPELQPQSLTIDFPLWKDIDNAAVGAAFTDDALAVLHAEPRVIP